MPGVLPGEAVPGVGWPAGGELCADAAVAGPPPDAGQGVMPGEAAPGAAPGFATLGVVVPGVAGAPGEAGFRTPALFEVVAPGGAAVRG
jgi:hypothetical protein